VSSPATLAEALEGLLRFGALSLRSGEAAFRVRDDMHLLAPRLGIPDFDMLATVTTLTATARANDERVTLVRHVGPLGINAWRLSALERLAQDGTGPITTAELTARLDVIEGARPLRADVEVALAMAAASAAFAWLNDGDFAAVLAAAVAGVLGQALRLQLLQRHLNQYAVTALCGIAAGGLYVAAAALLTRFGLPSGRGIGLIAAGLFLIPGFPLVAALLDLLQHLVPAALTRLAYGLTLMLAAAFGLGVVVAMVNYEPPATIAASHDSLRVVLRGVASFAGGCGFAVLYNSAGRVVLTVGILALAGNELRLGLQEVGMAQAPATLVGVLMVGLLASVAQPRLREPRIALTVPAIVIMVPGAAALEAVVLLSRGDTLGGLQSAVTVGFVIGAMALGLAIARFATERKWLFES
jgi:uncharacterized membrane protein YjjP (DUF1212 family)